MSTKKTAEERAAEKYPNSIKYGIFDSVSNIQFRKVYATCIREEVEPLEAWKESAIKVMGEWDKVWTALGNPGKLGESTAAASLAEVKRLRALVQVLLDIAKSDAPSFADRVSAIVSANEQGFVPTNTEDK
jgi:hypothetical protein